MSSPDQYPPPPQQEDQGGSSGGFGCLGLGIASVALLFLSVLGLCSGNSLHMAGFLAVLAVVAFIAAIIVGIVALFSRKR